MSNKVANLVLSLLVILFVADAAAIELQSNHSRQFDLAMKKQKLMAGVELLLVKNDIEQVISPSYQFKSGDHIRLRLRTSLESEYFLYILDKDGQAVKSLVIKGQTGSAAITLVPSPQQGILALEGKLGVEWLQLVVSAKSKLKSKPLRLMRDKHPNGKIEQVILRNIKLETPPEQQVHYDPESKIIYFSMLNPSKGGGQVSIKLGLTHAN